jgi:hypothetical protein
MVTSSKAEAARLAVLIDADNASSTLAKELLEEAAKYGTQPSSGPTGIGRQPTSAVGGITCTGTRSSRCSSSPTRMARTRPIVR